MKKRELKQLYLHRTGRRMCCFLLFCQSIKPASLFSSGGDCKDMTNSSVQSPTVHNTVMQQLKREVIPSSEHSCVASFLEKRNDVTSLTKLSDAPGYSFTLCHKWSVQHCSLEVKGGVSSDKRTESSTEAEGVRGLASCCSGPVHQNTVMHKFPLVSLAFPSKESD